MRDVLLDRDAEIAALSVALGRVRDGDGCVAVVEGPAGIGKSSLLAAAARTAAADGLTVLRARPGPLEQDAGWGVARELFAPLQDGPDWGGLTLGAAALSRRALDPAAPEPALAGDAMYAALHGLVWLATNLAARGPALLVVDDVHWADAPSLRWLVQLARRLDELPLGVLCAVRSGEPAGEPELLAELLAAAPEPPLRPRALGQDAAEALVRERLPAAVPGFARACHAVTAGNPFLLRSLLAHVLAERVQPTDAAAAGLSEFGPEQVGRSVERRLARLPAGAEALARALAVLGRPVPLRLAAPLAGLAPEDAAAPADALRVAGLVVGERELALAHPLVAGALHERLGPGERGLWHARAAALLTAEGAGPERVALHLLRTDPAAAAPTVATLRAAATEASARGAPETAATFLRRALTEPPVDPATAAGVRAELGLVLAAHVQPEAGALLAEAVTLAASPAQRVEIALRGSRALGLAGYFQDALDLSRRGLRHAADVAPDAAARLEAELVCDAWLRAETIPEGKARLRNPVVPADTLELSGVNAAWVATMAGRPAGETRELMRPAVESGALAGEPESLLGTTATFMLLWSDELDAACAACAGVIDRARPRGWLIALAHGSLMRATALVRAGRPREAEADARISFEFKRLRSPLAALLWSLSPLVDALVELDELEAADEALVAAGPLGETVPDALGAPLLLQARARLRLAQHRPADARADLLDAAARWHTLDCRHPGIASWRVEAAEAAVALGDLAAARELAGAHLELAETLGLPGPLSAGLRARARSAERFERVLLLERAVELVADSPCRLEHARALVDLGAALRRANRREDARRILGEGIDIAERAGMRLVARRARDELRAAGSRPRRDARSGPAALTAAEHRVARYAADGHTNREIAELLYITQRTVETHLTHAFAKLDISARAQLPDALGEVPALPV